MGNCTGKRCESYAATQFCVGQTLPVDKSERTARKNALIDAIMVETSDQDVFAYLTGETQKVSRKRLKRMRLDDLFDLYESLA